MADDEAKRGQEAEEQSSGKPSPPEASPPISDEQLSELWDEAPGRIVEAFGGKPKGLGKGPSRIPTPQGAFLTAEEKRFLDGLAACREAFSAEAAAERSEKILGGGRRTKPRRSR